MCNFCLWDYASAKLLHFVESDLNPNCLQRLSADDTSRQRVNGLTPVCY